MNREPSHVTRPMYGRVTISEAQKCLEEMSSSDRDGVYLSSSGDKENRNTRPGFSRLEEANKENSSSYAVRFFGSSVRTSATNDQPIPNSVYRPSRAKSILATSKPNSKEEGIHVGQLADLPLSLKKNVMTDSSVLHPEEAFKSCNMNTSVDDSFRGFSANQGLVTKINTDVPMKTPGSLCNIKQESRLQALSTGMSVHRLPARVPVYVQELQSEEAEEDEEDGDLLEKSTRMSEFDISFSADESFRALGLNTSRTGHSSGYQRCQSSSAKVIWPQTKGQCAKEPVVVKSRVGETLFTKASSSDSVSQPKVFTFLESTAQKTRKPDGNTTAGGSTERDGKHDNTFESANTGNSLCKHVWFADPNNDSQRSGRVVKCASTGNLGTQHLVRIHEFSSSGSIYRKSPPMSDGESVNDGQRRSSEFSESLKRSVTNCLEMSGSGVVRRESLANVDLLKTVEHQQSPSRNTRTSDNAALQQKPSRISGILDMPDIPNRPAGDPPYQREGQGHGIQASSSITGQKPVANTNSVIVPALTTSLHAPEVKNLVINGNVYTMLRLIGQGGSSVVYQGYGPDCQTCAIKCVSFESAEESLISSYKNEIKLLQRLQTHDEIVQLRDYVFDKAANKLFVVMECGEMDLQTFFRIKRSNMLVYRLLIRPYWIEMLSAVQVLHRQGIVHSDLKPANFILVCGKVKLIDFGIAKTVLPDCTSVLCDEIVGTFNYMSPEAITDLNGGRGLDGEWKPNIKISTKSDIWSLGCFLYCLVYSHTPFENIRNQLLKIQAIVNPNHEIRFPQTNVPHVVDVLKKCLDRNPKNRPTIEELLQHPYVTCD